MAEILLSLTIIGVVAAITLPSLTGNINERTWNTQRKALYARFSQAIALMPALNGYGTYETVSAGGSSSVNDNVAETFITGGLAKVLKINNICDKDNIFDCGFASKITTIGGSQMNLPRKMTDLNPAIPANGELGFTIYDTNAAAFETINGESILTFYNPNCTSESMFWNGTSNSGVPGLYMKPQMCAHFVFDLNGAKGPNTVGKDIGVISAIYSSDTNVVIPQPIRMLDATYSQSQASKECSKLDTEYRLPNIEEMLSMFYSKNLFDWNTVFGSWSSTSENSTNAWIFGPTGGMKYSVPKNDTYHVQCVKR
ncbi:MAG: hypothetical protein NC390_01680 [Fusobacterium sp.]|nr:hypothetical protein [Fusobacterium sp.]